MNGKESGITFFAGETKEKYWIMNLSKDGIKFNRERWKDWQPEDFAVAVCNILENEFCMKISNELEDGKFAIVFKRKGLDEK